MPLCNAVDRRLGDTEAAGNLRRPWRQRSHPPRLSITRAHRALLAPEQFVDTIDALSPNNPKVKGVDIKSMIDTSFVQNAVDKGLASPP
jgi:hypothetical protein